MKHIKFLAIAFVSMLALASCNTDQEGPIYTPMSENVSLSQETQSYMTEDAEIDIPVRFVRSDTKNESTIHYTLDSKTADYFSDPNNGQVTFKAGQGVAEVTFKAVNMVKGTTYDAILSLSDDDAAKADTITKNAILKTAISVMCDYEWEDAGTVKFSDTVFGDGTDTVDVKIKHAVTDDVKLYKLIAPYTALYGPADQGGIGEADIKFYLNDDYSAKSLEKQGKLDLIPGSGYQFYFDTKNYPNYCYIANNGNEFEVSSLLYNESDGKLYGPGSFSFVWDKWPGNK